MSLVLEELTAPGRGGISVLSLRGAGALDHLRHLANGTLPAPGELRLVRLRVGDELLDEALVHSEGPDHVELSLHGSPAVVRRVAAELGLSLASPHDRAARATSLEEEARCRLAHAPCEAAARVLLDQAEGALRRALEALDPGDDDSFPAGVDALLEAGRRARYLLHPPVVVLAGPVNAGKSTLYNLLLDRERVVVSDTAGTTRDAVRERTLLGAHAVDLVDTAGDRTPRGEGREPALERAGVELGRRVRRGADLVFWLARDPDAAPETDDDAVPLVRLTSAADLLDADARGRGRNPISVVDDPIAARTTVERLFHEALRLPPEPWRPGRAVPFSMRIAEALASLRRVAGESARRSALDDLLVR